MEWSNSSIVLQLRQKLIQYVGVKRTGEHEGEK
jgi:hypothetical protein